jgi:hypothetical protein
MLPKTPRPPHSLSLLPVNFQNVDFGGWQSPRWQIPGSLNGCVEQSPFPPVTLVELICCNSYLSLVGLKGGAPAEDPCNVQRHSSLSQWLEKAGHCSWHMNMGQVVRHVARNAATCPSMYRRVPTAKNSWPQMSLRRVEDSQLTLICSLSTPQTVPFPTVALAFP